MTYTGIIDRLERSYFDTMIEIAVPLGFGKCVLPYMILASDALTGNLISFLEVPKKRGF